MNRPLFAALFAAALATQMMSARDGLADGGRYQLIPKVPIPGQTGTSREQAILLDTKTGQTWRLVWDVKQGKNKGALWLPMDLVFAEELNPGRTSLAARGARKSESAGTKAARKNTSHRRLDEDYDDDP